MTGWLRILREAETFRWSKRSLRGATLSLPAIAVWLFVALDGRFTTWATYAVAGAFTAAFGAFQKLGATRAGPVGLLLVGVAGAAWAGNVAGHFGWYWTVTLATACGFGFGALTLLGYGGWWMGLQWMIGLLVYGAHARAPLDAARESLAIVVGGASQLLFLGATRRFSDRWFSTQDQPPFEPVESLADAFLRNVNPAHAAGRYALRVATAMAACTVVAHFQGLPNGYWIAMTAVILLKPDFHEATIRGVSRLIGTIAGAGVITVLIAVIRPDRAALGCLVLAAIWGCLALLRVNYSLFVTCVTSYVVLLFSLLGLPGPRVALDRAVATLIGATIALLVSLVPTRTRVPTDVGPN